MADRPEPVREVYRDRWLLVVDKPSGLATQPTQDGDDNLHDRLAWREKYVGLHHRLDQPASGLVLFTLDPAANKAIAEAFRTHTARRTYRAVLWGDAEDSVWTAPIDGKRARSRVRVIARAGGFTAVEIAIETGRTHQIRRHAALAGVPIVGDRRYGGDAAHAWPRLALHAARLELTHPVTGAPLAFESPMPPDLAEIWSLAGGPAPVSGPAPP